MATLAAIATMAVGMTAGVKPAKAEDNTSFSTSANAHAASFHAYLTLDPVGGTWPSVMGGSGEIQFPVFARNKPWTMIYGGGNMPLNQTWEFNNNTNNGLKPIPTKNGYTFTGFNTNKDGSGEGLLYNHGDWSCDPSYHFNNYADGDTKYAPFVCLTHSDSITGNNPYIIPDKYQNITLYAQWKPSSSYTVTFDPNGGTLAASSKATVTPGKTLGSTPTPTWVGHVFDGWNTSKTGHGQWVDSSFKPTGSTTVYAQWETGSTPVAAQGSLTIKYDANGGNGAPAATTDKKPQGTRVGTPISTLTPSWAGHIFTGWNTQANGKGTEVSLGGSYAWTPSATPQTVTLYAQWQQVSHVENLPSAGGDLWISLAIVLVALAGGAAIAIGRKKKALAK